MHSKHIKLTLIFLTFVGYSALMQGETQNRGGIFPTFAQFVETEQPKDRVKNALIVKIDIISNDNLSTTLTEMISRNRGLTKNEHHFVVAWAKLLPVGLIDAETILQWQVIGLRKYKYVSSSYLYRDTWIRVQALAYLKDTARLLELCRSIPGFEGPAKRFAVENFYRVVVDNNLDTEENIRAIEELGAMFPIRDEVLQFWLVSRHANFYDLDFWYHSLRTGQFHVVEYILAEDKAKMKLFFEIVSNGYMSANTKRLYNQFVIRMGTRCGDYLSFMAL